MESVAAVGFRRVLFVGAFAPCARASCTAALPSAWLGAGGRGSRGFFPQLQELFGPMSFDFDAPELRLTRFLGSSSELASSYVAAWCSMQEDRCRPTTVPVYSYSTVL